MNLHRAMKHRAIARTVVERQPPIITKVCIPRLEIHSVFTDPPRKR